MRIFFLSGVLLAPFGNSVSLVTDAQSCEFIDDFESSQSGQWTSNLANSTLSFNSPGADGSAIALQVEGRATKHDGPKHPFLTADCLNVGYQYELSADIKMVDEGTGEGFMCDILACNDDSVCPLLTIEYKKENGERQWEYYENELGYDWKQDEFNKFRQYVQVSDAMSKATEVFFYFERPSAGVTIMIDNVKITEFQPVPDGYIFDDGGIMVMSPTCDNLVVNGDAEIKNTGGWKPRLGGKIMIRPEGADQTSYSFEHNGRTAFISGPSHKLATGCFIDGMRYIMDAKVKLEDENNVPYYCNKAGTWVDDYACPILTLEVETYDDRKRWHYFRNEDVSDWVPDTWNKFHVLIDATEDFDHAVDGEFYLERPKKGLSIIYDQVTISRDCTKLIYNSDIDTNTTVGWRVMDGSEGIKIAHEGADDTSEFSLGHYGRETYETGLGHYIDIGCLVSGRKYAFRSMIKLIDELADNAGVSCSKDASPGSGDACPVLKLTAVIDENGGKVDYDFVNTNTSAWDADSFNPFTATFTVDDTIANALSAYIVVGGPRAGVAILMDQISIDLFEDDEPNCESLIQNGFFDDDGISGWVAGNKATISKTSPGALDSDNALLIDNREAAWAGAKTEIAAACLVEGREYHLNALVRLYDSTGAEFACDKTKPHGDALACPVMAINYQVPSGDYKMHHIQNYDWNSWGADNWNVYDSVFTVTTELNYATNAHLLVKGAATGIKIVVDSITLDKHVPLTDVLSYLHRTNYCSNMIYNPGANFDNLLTWKVLGNGHIEIRSEEIEIDGRMTTNKYFAHIGRGIKYQGPKHDLETTCFREVGVDFDFHAQLKLLDLNGNPYACKRDAAWGTEFTCPLLSISMSLPGGNKLLNIHNQAPGPEKADGWNVYEVLLTVTEEMKSATSMYFWFRGPPKGHTILFDDVTFSPHNCDCGVEHDIH